MRSEPKFQCEMSLSEFFVAGRDAEGSEASLVVILRAIMSAVKESTG